MTEREAILARVREGLQIKAHVPGQHGAPTSEPAPRPFQQWMPGVGESFDEQIAAFAKASSDLKTDFRLVDSEGEAATALKEIATAEGWSRVATHGHALTDAICPELALPILETDGGYDVNELEQCDAGISACDALIAQTGSALVTSRSAGGRALSVLPPHHVVLARRDQIVRDLSAAFRLIHERYGIRQPSFIGFITGPSRTGDIERILVLGAHGPKKLTIICW